MFKTFAVVAMLVVDDPIVYTTHEFFFTNFYYYMLHKTDDAKAYHEKWLQRRWKELCKGGGRYEAMAEAYEMGRPNPCNGAKEWKR